MDLVGWIKEAGGQKVVKPIAPASSHKADVSADSNIQPNFGADYNVAPLAKNQTIRQTNGYGSKTGEAMDANGNSIHISHQSNTLNMQGRNNSVQYAAENGMSAGNTLRVEGDQNRIVGYNGANYDNSIAVAGSQNIVLVGVGAHQNNIDVNGVANRVQLTSQASQNNIDVKGEQINLNILGSENGDQHYSKWEIALVGDNYSLSIVNGNVQLEFKKDEHLRYEVMIDEVTKRIVIEPKKEDSEKAL